MDNELLREDRYRRVDHFGRDNGVVNSRGV